ncbi:MAG TPA: hypothetical protein VM734_05810 [Kofleriaceae bacterium]|jgi:hypothetical protein|nr:hypothetical protein [Kofleriaceae bacterium]
MVEVLERGDVAFFIRPRVQPADGQADTPGVQRFFLVLGAGERHRRLRIGRKALPVRRGQRFWATVERVGSLDRVVGDQLEAETYATRTRGERYQPPARAVAHGEYAMVRHDDHTHLVYRVDHADDADRLPEEVTIPDAGSFVLLFKHPRGRARWTTEGDPRELDIEDAEVVLIGVGEEPSAAAEVAAAAALSARAVDGR